MHLTDEQQMIRDMVRDVAAAEIEPRIAEIETSVQVPADIAAKLAELNLMGLLLPDSQGGAGLDMAACCLVIEELARASAGVALAVAAHNVLALPAVAHAAASADAAVQAAAAPALRELAAGTHLGAFAWPAAAPDGREFGVLQPAGQLATLDGTLDFLTNAAAARWLVVASGDAGVFLVDAEGAGVQVQPIEQTGLRGSGTSHVTLGSVRAVRLVGPGDAPALVEPARDRARLAVAAVSLGVAAAAFERATRYAREREQFGRPIAAFEAIQWKLADMDAGIHAARLALYDAAGRVDAGVGAGRDALRARVLASAAAMRAADHAVQIHGGYGYCTEYHVERCYRDAKLCEIVWETSDAERLAIAADLLRAAESGAAAQR
jgi:alkylation response protein AidB-like acyl-CoA dehydrogenase